METPFRHLPLGNIRPQGWLLNQLEVQATGLTGHLDEIWPDCGLNSGWLGGTENLGNAVPTTAMA